MFKAFDVQTAKIYAKKPRPGRGMKPFHNPDPPITMSRKRRREEGEDQRDQQRQENTGNDNDRRLD